MDKFVVPAVLITACVILLTEGIKSVALHFGHDISGRAAMLAAAIVGLGVGLLQVYLPTLSPESQTATVQVLVTIGAILMAYGGNDLLKQRGK